MDLSSKKIGIWGYGIVGKATDQYLTDKNISISVCDARTLSEPDMHALNSKNIRFYSQQEIILFLESHDLIIPSPGINLEPYAQFAHKWISELDLFADDWHKPIIAITGTVGKTTVTNLVDLLLQYANIPAAIGGNIGIGMLSLIAQQETKKYAILELSSWQLEQCNQFAPSIALWTNFSENHLDRHKTMDNYFNAKYQIIAHQSKHHIAIIPLELIAKVYKRKPKSSVIFFCNSKPKLYSLRQQDTIFYLHDNHFYLIHEQKKVCIAQNVYIPDYSFTDNWIAICTLLYTLNLPIKLINQIDLSSYTQSDRLELICTKNGISFYNDSKSTTPASTLASVNKFVGKRIHLFLGGLSKGTDRASLITAIKDKVEKVYCFGKEAQELKKMCDQEKITAYAFADLENAFNCCTQNCQPEDIVLFSPAGSSFDLFENYEERGRVFKKIVRSIYS